MFFLVFLIVTLQHTIQTSFTTQKTLPWLDIETVYLSISETNEFAEETYYYDKKKLVCSILYNESTNIKTFTLGILDNPLEEANLYKENGFFKKTKEDASVLSQQLSDISTTDLPQYAQDYALHIKNYALHIAKLAFLSQETTAYKKTFNQIKYLEDDDVTRPNPLKLEIICNEIKRRTKQRTQLHSTSF